MPPFNHEYKIRAEIETNLQCIEPSSIQENGETNKVTVLCHNIWKKSLKCYNVTD